MSGRAPDAPPPVRRALPGAILFCCNHNSVRSPLAEGLMKRRFGRRVFVQSCGVREAEAVDGFMLAAAAEIGIDLSRHRPRSFDEMEAWGDDITAYDLIVALSPAAQRQALERTRTASVDVVYWPILDPVGLGETREQRLVAYREAREQIAERMRACFGLPEEPTGSP
ncbi:MAG: low molecular weight phosphatase family protein [Paracoccaceae bacterium]